MLTPELLITAYESGYFPMAETRDATELLWFSPDPRAIIPLNAVHLSRSLKKALRQRPYRVTINHNFTSVMQACAAPRDGERDSWINTEIMEAYVALHELGYAHSLECWDAETLVGGLYGVSRGGAFFGESMFSRQDNASKIAFAYLVEILRCAGYTLLDTQFVNPHLLQFGVIEIPRTHYLTMLKEALTVTPNPSHRFVTVSRDIAASEPSAFIFLNASSA
jgi:leucyl/phenylalanyl-tRNA---protein transferase